MALVEVLFIVWLNDYGRFEGWREKAVKSVMILFISPRGEKAAIQQQLSIKSKSTVYRLLRLDGIEPGRK